MVKIKINATEIKHSNTPLWLQRDPRFVNLLPIARLLYGEFRRRYMLSVNSARTKNKYVDNRGEVFFIYTVKELQETLGVSDKTITRAKRSLIKVGLIKEKVQGCNLPNLYYLTELDFYNKREVESSESLIQTESDKNSSSSLENNNIIKNNIINIVNKDKSVSNVSKKSVSKSSRKKAKKTWRDYIPVTNKKKKSFTPPLPKSEEVEVVGVAEQVKNAVDKLYPKFASGRWSKKAWVILSAEIVDYIVKRIDTVNSIPAYARTIVERAAINHDLKKAREAEKELILEEYMNEKTDTSYIEDTLSKLQQQTASQQRFTMISYAWV